MTLVQHVRAIVDVKTAQQSDNRGSHLAAREERQLLLQNGSEAGLGTEVRRRARGPLRLVQRIGEQHHLRTTDAPS